MGRKSRQDAVAQFPPDLSVGDGLQRLIADWRRSLHRQVKPASAGNTESIHRFRVGLRRLRSMLSAFSEVLPDRERRALGDRLRAAAQRYGRTREWDVFLASIVSPLRAALPEEAALIELQQLVEEARTRSLPPGDLLSGAVADVDAALDAALWLHHPASGFDAQWRARLRDHAAALLESRHRRLRKAVKRIDLGDQEAFHKLRIKIKKTRYLSELVAPIYDNECAKSYLDRLVAVQDVMGRLNDAAIARGLLGELIVPPHAHHLVSGWIAHDLQSNGARFPEIARAFRHVEPFWEQ